MRFGGSIVDNEEEYMKNPMQGDEKTKSYHIFIEVGSLVDWVPFSGMECNVVR